MSEIFKENQKIKTPVGDAFFCYLTEPDEYEGALSYKFNIILDPANNDEHAEFKATIDANAQDAFDKGKAELMKGNGKQKASAKELALHVPYISEYDDDTGDETGRIILRVSSKATGVSKKTNKPWRRTIPLFDANAKDVTGKVERIYGGSKLIGELIAKPFCAAGLKKAGLSFQINAVQIVSAGGGNAGGSFGVEEGGDFDGAGLQDVDPMATGDSQSYAGDVGDAGDSNPDF